MKLSNKEVELLDKYFRLLNYMSVGMLYLKDNPLLKEELSLKHIKNQLVAGVLRVEQRPRLLESRMLPLHHTPIIFTRFIF